MSKPFTIAIILEVLLALAASSQRAGAQAPTNTPVHDQGPTWTAVVYPTSAVATNTPVVDRLPYPTSTPLPVIGEPWGPCLWLTVVLR